MQTGHFTGVRGETFHQRVAMACTPNLSIHSRDTCRFLDNGKSTAKKQ